MPQKKSDVLREKLKTNLLKQIHEVSAKDFRKNGNYAEEFEVVVNEMSDNEAYLAKRGQELLNDAKKDQEIHGIDQTFLQTESGKAVFKIFFQILDRTRT